MEDPVLGQSKNKTILFTSVGLVTVIIIIVVVISSLGKAYKGSISQFETKNKEVEIKDIKKKEIRRISFRRSGSEECNEITKDGIVRQYESCGGELVNATRLIDQKHVTKLYRLISEGRLGQYQGVREGNYIELIIETDEGTEVVIINLDDDLDDNIEDIVETIDDIEESVPDPTPSALPSIVPTPSPGDVTPTPVPTPTPGGPTPTPSPGEATGTFTCNFVDDQTGKPYNVSNVICSDEPIPAN